MKQLILLLSFLTAQASFAGLNLECKNPDGVLKLMATSPCKNCGKQTPAFSFIGGEGILSDGIPGYDAEMPGYIDFDKASSAETKQDVIGLVDGGTWWISIYFPKGFLKSHPAKGKTVQATMDSSYSDIMESELNDIKLTCTVL